jgi:hypothetical protein
VLAQVVAWNRPHVFNWCFNALVTPYCTSTCDRWN